MVGFYNPDFRDLEGANAIIAMHYDANEIAPGVAEVLPALLLERGAGAVGEPIKPTARRPRCPRSLPGRAPVGADDG